MIQHRLPRLLKMPVLVGLTLAAAAFLLWRISSPPLIKNPNLPETRWQQALDQGLPTLVFVHSEECQPCRRMIGRVGLVYPEFAEQVTLIDVDVYDEQNKPFLKKLGVGYFPTLLLYDQSGKQEKVVGVIEIDELRRKLSVLTGGE